MITFKAWFEQRTKLEPITPRRTLSFMWEGTEGEHDFSDEVIKRDQKQKEPVVKND